MKSLYNITFLVIIIFTFSISSFSQIQNKTLEPCKDSTELIYQKWYVGGLLGMNSFFGDISDGSSIFGGGVDGEFSWLVQLQAGREINNFFGIRGDFSTGKLVSSKNSNWFEADIIDLNANLTINISNVISPYKYNKKWNTTAIIGAGLMGYRSILYDKNENIINSVGYKADGSKDNIEYSSQIAFGIAESYRISKNLDVNLEIIATKLFIDDLDSKISGNANDLRTKFGIGLTYYFGKSKKSYKYNSEPCIMKVDIVNNTNNENIGSNPTNTVINPCDTSTVDSDGDSVPDCRDLEPNSEDGSIVNFQGKAINSPSSNEHKTPNSTNSTPKSNPKTGYSSSSMYFSPVFFKYKEYKIADTERKALLNISVYLKQNPNIRLLLVGNTDNIGSDKYNNKLSNKRLNSVKKSLVNDFGILESRIDTEAAGKSNILFEKNNDGNRRVDFIIQ